MAADPGKYQELAMLFLPGSLLRPIRETLGC